MKIQFLENVMHNHSRYSAGEVVEIAEKEAKNLCENGLAKVHEELEAFEQPEETLVETPDIFPQENEVTQDNITEPEIEEMPVEPEKNAAESEQVEAPEVEEIPAEPAENKKGSKKAKK